MQRQRVFTVKLQLHFGGDVHDICVSAHDGAEPTVTDLMSLLERDFHVPRALQNIVFHGQALQSYLNSPLSHFGIRNGATVRLVGRMAPPDMIHEINAQCGGAYSYNAQVYVCAPLNAGERNFPDYYETSQQGWIQMNPQ